ncbi:hypothetical protein VKT23_010012 [Stygiomarasmius scandens]|uniref:Uncharacterized protein n=1 Tax=Marasmiellus scandens TaxID=2682957 RepID=A0ABR1JFI5_9AGAR
MKPSVLARPQIFGCLPLVTNLLATSAIGYKAWFHRQRIKQNLLLSSSPDQVQKILLLLIESGLIYSFFWAGYVVDGFLINGQNTSYEISLVAQTYGAVLPIISALYPALIILIAALEKFKWESSQSVTLSRSIHFAAVSAAASSQA